MQPTGSVFLPVVTLRLVRSGSLPYKQTVNSAYGIVKMVFPLIFVTWTVRVSSWRWLTRRSSYRRS